MESSAPPARLRMNDPHYTVMMRRYSKAMAEREARVQELMDPQDRWDAWMYVAQARLLDNFTSTQWKVREAPKYVHDALYENFHKHYKNAPRERKEGEPNFSGVKGPVDPDFVEQEALNYWVLDELLPLHEEWSGVKLEPTSVYGARIYREGSTLADHLDIPETHVISSILHIDSKLDEPFPIEIEDALGEYAGVDLKPGQMMFYESAKCFHRRSVPMKGEYYASLFLHYRPVNWTFSRNEIKLAVPPYWNEGLPTAGAAPEPAEPAAPPRKKPEAKQPVAPAPAPGEPTEIRIRFRLEGAGDGEMRTIEWMRGDEPPATLLALDAHSPEGWVKTFPGHQFEARDRDGKKEPQRFTARAENDFFIVHGERSAAARTEL